SSGQAVEQLGVFENIGLGCSWQLDVPPRFNNIQYSTAVDVTLVVGFLCQHNSALAKQDLAHLPRVGHGQFWLSLREQGVDASGNRALGRLESAGQATVLIVPDWLPRNVRRARIKDVSVICTLKSNSALGLNLRFWRQSDGDSATMYR